MSHELARLLTAAAALEREIGVPVAIIEGVARGAWASVRATQDVDVIVGTEDLGAVVAAAPRVGLIAVPEEVATLASADMTRLRLPELPRGPVRMDVLAASHDYYYRLLARSRQVIALGTTVRVAGPEDIILLKLLADRPQDRADVAAILGANPNLDWGVLRDEADRLGLDLGPIAPRS